MFEALGWALSRKFFQLSPNIRKIALKRDRYSKRFSLKLLFIIIFLSSLFLPVAAADVIDVEIYPENPFQGDNLRILLKAEPEEEVTVTISYIKEVWVSNGKYEYRIEDVVISREWIPVRATVKAVDVENLHISARIPGVLPWITVSKTAENGVATVSMRIPLSGIYEVRIHGEAVGGISTLSIHFSASTRVVADKDGYYEYVYNTSSIPTGIFTAQIGGISRTFQLLEPGAKPPPQPPPSPEMLERMHAEEAADALMGMNWEEAAEIIVEVSTMKAGAIVDQLTSERAVAILTAIDVGRSASILQEVSASKAADIVMEAVDRGLMDEIIDILLAVDKDSLTTLITMIQPASAALIVESMAEEDMNHTANVVKASADLNMASMSLVLESVETHLLVRLLIEIARPTSTSSVAAIFEALNLEKTLEVVRAWIPCEALRLLSSVFEDLTPEKLNNIYGSLTIDEREAIHPHLSKETIVHISPDLLPLPDNTASTITVTKIDTKDYTVWAEVKNQGNIDSDSFNVHLNVDSYLIDKIEIEGLSAGATTTLTFEWKPKAKGRFNLEVAVDPEDLVEEINENNNTAQTTISVEKEEATSPWIYAVPAITAVLLALAALGLIARAQLGHDQAGP